MPKSTQQDPHAEREARRYESPIASREHILEILSEQGPLDFRELCSALMLKGHENRDALRKRLRAMQRDGQAFCNRAEAWGVPSKMDLLRGKVQAHRDGFGFLLVDDGDDIYLSERQMRQVFHGDEVLVRLAGKNRRGQDEGKIVEVVNRAMSRIVGRLERESGIDFVVPDNPRIAHDILIDRDVSRETLSGEKPAVGDYVTVEIIDYPTQRTQAVGQVVEILGAPMAPGLEIELSLRSHDIPHEWPGAVMSEAALSFLGLGMPVTKPSLGSLITAGFEYIFSGSWWITIFPGILLVTLILVINLLGDWVRMRDLYSVYMLFLVVVAARYGWRAISAFRHGADIDQPGHEGAAKP